MIFLRHLYYLVLPPSRSHSVGIIFVMRSFLYTLLFAMRGLFAWSILMLHEAAPLPGLRLSTLSSVRQSHIPYVQWCRLPFISNPARWIPVPASSLLESLTTIETLSLEALISLRIADSISWFTALFWPNLLTSFFCFEKVTLGVSMW